MELMVTKEGVRNFCIIQCYRLKEPMFLHLHSAHIWKYFYISRWMVLGSWEFLSLKYSEMS